MESKAIRRCSQESRTRVDLSFMAGVEVKVTQEMACICPQINVVLVGIEAFSWHNSVVQRESCKA